MSVDPMTGRNPSYCFVDLVSKDLAEGVMEMYNGRLFRERALRVKPGVKSGRCIFSPLRYLRLRGSYFPSIFEERSS